MKNYQTLFALPLLALSFHAFASSGAGNGGDALVCHDSPDYGNQVILLDSHEAHKRKLTINLNNPTVAVATHRSMVNVALARLMKKDVATAGKLYTYAMEMVNDLEMKALYPDARSKVLYIGNDVVGAINDSLHVTIPIGCVLKQLVSQKTPKYKLDFRYEVNKSIWDQMDMVEQSMTILHEAWYRIMIENDDKIEHNSYGARYINGLVASEEFEDYSFTDYIQDLKETEMRNYEIINTSSALINDIVTVPLKGMELVTTEDTICVSDLYVPAQLKKFDVGAIFNGIKTLKVKFTKFCFKNSKVVLMEIPQDVSDKGFLLSMENYQINVHSNTSANAVMIFHENGKLDHITNVKTDFLLKMYYKCGGVKTFVKANGCSGPYRFDDSKVSNPGQVLFSSVDESPIGFEFPALN